MVKDWPEPQGSDTLATASCDFFPIQPKRISGSAGYVCMDRPARDAYSPTNFREWQETNSLELTPKFQRRSIWKLPQRSYLIESILLGMPIPPIYLRNRYDTKLNKVVRQVIDGQQRLRSVLDYTNDGFALSSKLDGPYAGKRYSSLSNSERTAIISYRFICESFDDISDREVLDMFQRLNMVSIPLSSQELRNGRYFGPFKRTCYRLAYDFLEWWRTSRIVSETQLSRMLEAQLTSELIIAQLDGMQDKKKSITEFYEKFDSSFPDQKVQEKRFRTIMDQIGDTFGASLSETEFRRPPFFYTLYCAVYHRVFGLKNQQLQTPKKKLTGPDRDSLREAVENLSSVITAAKDERKTPDKYERFALACVSQTDNIQPRQTRLTTLYKEAFG